MPTASAAAAEQRSSPRIFVNLESKESQHRNLEFSGKFHDWVCLYTTEYDIKDLKRFIYNHEHYILVHFLDSLTFSIQTMIVFASVPGYINIHDAYI